MKMTISEKSKQSITKPNKTKLNMIQADKSLIFLLCHRETFVNMNF